jgi:hypothetical protein
LNSKQNILISIIIKESFIKVWYEIIIRQYW